MKSRIVFILILVILMISVGSCATVTSKIPGTGTVKGAAKDKFMKGSVEVVEVKMEKTEIDDPNSLDNFKVTGTAIYHPAKVDAKSFKDCSWSIRVEFYDKSGIKLPFKIDCLDCGEYGKEENIKPNVPFPFKGETGTAYIGIDNFKKAASCKVTSFKSI